MVGFGVKRSSFRKGTGTCIRSDTFWWFLCESNLLLGTPPFTLPPSRARESVTLERDPEIWQQQETPVPMDQASGPTGSDLKLRQRQYRSC